MAGFSGLGGCSGGSRLRRSRRRRLPRRCARLRRRGARPQRRAGFSGRRFSGRRASATGAAALARLARRRTGFSTRRLQPALGCRRAAVSRRPRRCRSCGGFLGEGRQGFGRFSDLAGAGAACGRLGLGLGGRSRRRRCLSAGLLRGVGSCPPRPPRRLRCCLRERPCGGSGPAASAVWLQLAASAAPSATSVSSLPATTWSLSICGDTPAPDVPPHPAPVGANICQHPQALTEVNWIPSGSHRQWGAAALEGRRNCSETRCSTRHNQVPSNGIAGQPGSEDP